MYRRFSRRLASEELRLLRLEQLRSAPRAAAEEPLKASLQSFRQVRRVEPRDQEGGVGTNIPLEIPHAGGQTLAATLQLAAQYAARIDFLQLATWNDFGEGTMFEPTVEFGFSYLEQLQEFTGVPYDKSELELVYRLYRARKDFANDAAKQALLDQAAASLAALDVEEARSSLELAAPAGDFDGDGDVDGRDFLTWQRQLGAVGLFPVSDQSADANADGVVDAADLQAWRQSVAAAAATNVPAVIETHGAAALPEPSAGVLLAISVAWWLLRARGIADQ